MKVFNNSNKATITGKHSRKDHNKIRQCKQTLRGEKKGIKEKQKQL
jgi:hypothetical protein